MLLVADFNVAVNEFVMVLALGSIRSDESSPREAAGMASLLVRVGASGFSRLVGLLPREAAGMASLPVGKVSIGREAVSGRGESPRSPSSRTPRPLCWTCIA